MKIAKLLIHLYWKSYFQFFIPVVNPNGIENETLHEVTSGKSLRGKTLFKGELPLWMMLLSKAEGKINSIEDVRSKFILHWERGIELIAEKDNQDDWIHLIASIYPPQDSQ